MAHRPAVPGPGRLAGLIGFRAGRPAVSPGRDRPAAGPPPARRRGALLVPSRPGLDVHAYLPRLHRYLAAGDLAIVQGGLTTCMELTASGRRFLYVPLRHHFEQQFHVTHRLRRYGAGSRLDYADLSPDVLAAAIAAEIGREVSYAPVATDGAARAARLLADLL